MLFVIHCYGFRDDVKARMRLVLVEKGRETVVKVPELHGTKVQISALNGQRARVALPKNGLLGSNC